jgi:predicted ATPase
MHPRHIAPLLADALLDTPVVLINGARQSGKSTLVQSLANPAGIARQYLTLDDAVVLNAAKSDPAGSVSLTDGGCLSVPVAWFQRPAHASSAQRADYQSLGNGKGIH